MKKLFVLFLSGILFLAFLSVGYASSSKNNPYNNRFKYETVKLHEAGMVKNIFVVFDANQNQIKKDIVVVYRDASGVIKEASADEQGRVFVSFKQANYFNLLQLKVAGVQFDIIGDSFEDFDYDDIREGEVNFYALQYDNQTKMARIYDAD